MKAELTAEKAKVLPLQNRVGSQAAKLLDLQHHADFQAAEISELEKQVGGPWFHQRTERLIAETEDLQEELEAVKAKALALKTRVEELEDAIAEAGPQIKLDFDQPTID